MLEKLVLEAEQAVWECCRKRCSVPPVKGFVGVSTSMLSAVRSLTLVEANSVFLSHSQHTQLPSLFTNFSLESL